MSEGEKTRLVAWSRELRGVHDRLREALTVTRQALAAGEPAEPAIRDLLLFCHGFCIALTAHHEGEDRDLDPPPEVLGALDLQPGEKAVVRRRLILLDEQAVELADSYYPASIATGTVLAEAKKIRGGAVTLLGDLGHATAEILEEITARLPHREEMSLLKIDKDEPLMVLARLSRDAAGAPVEYAVNRMVATMTPPLTYRTRTSAP